MSDTPPERTSFTIPSDLRGARLDVALSHTLDLSRSQAAKHIKQGRVLHNDAPTQRPATRVEVDDRITWIAPARKAPALDLTAEARPVDILYEDADILVVNKASQVVIHPSDAHPTGTLVHALLHHAPDIASIGETHRPGIVHRIDKETSGVVVVARTERAYTELQSQFAAHTVERHYLALAAQMHGPGLQEAGTIESLHGRAPNDRRRFTGTRGHRNAITHYRVQEYLRDGALLVECRLQTGRTHQIRMHLREAGVPIIGDALYGPATRDRFPIIDRTALHAHRLRIALPWMPARTFEAPLPTDFKDALAALKSSD